MSQHTLGLARCIRHRGERCCGRDDALVICWAESAIPGRAIASRQPPAIRTIAGKTVRIGDAVGAVNQRVGAVLLPVIRITIAEAARIETEKGILREEQRSAAGRPEWKLDSVIALSVAERWAAGPSAVVGGRRDRM